MPRQLATRQCNLSRAEPSPRRCAAALENQTGSGKRTLRHRGQLLQRRREVRLEGIGMFRCEGAVEVDGLAHRSERFVAMPQDAQNVAEGVQADREGGLERIGVPRRELR